MKNKSLIIVLLIFFSCKKDKIIQSVHDDECSNWSKIKYFQSENYLSFSVKVISFSSQNIYIFANSINYSIPYEGGIIFKSNDSGLNWKEIKSGTYDFIGPNNVFALEGDTVLATCYGTTSFGSQFQISYNGGITWTSKSLGNTYYYNEPLCIFFINSSLGYIGTDNGLIKTSDGGNSWISISNLENKRINSIFCIDSNIIYLIGDSSCFKTTDGGQNWTEIYDSAYLITGIDFLDFNHGILSTTNGVFLTIDGGNSWNQIYFYNTRSITFKENNVIYLIDNNNNVLSTFDGGNNWNNECISDIKKTVIKSNLVNYYCGTYQEINKINESAINTQFMILKK